VLYALGQPISFVGLLVGFVLSLAVRAVAQRAVLRALGLHRFGARRGFSLRHDVDPFGAVAAAIGGAGWGRPLDVAEVPRTRGRLAAAAVFAAGPVAALIAAVGLLGAFAAGYGDDAMLHLNVPSTGLLGVYGEDPGAQFLLSLALAPLGFALFTLVPIPPLDGFGLLWCCFRHPGPGIAKYKHWFADNNIGVAVLLLVLIVPFLRAPFFIVIDLAAAPLMRAWT
jgi:Zn-dependent protease